jgi:flagellin-like hook-associated protein FlgL
MSTLGSVMNTAMRSIMANQYALSVSSNNIANANNPDSSRQRLIMRPAGPAAGPVTELEGLRDQIISAANTTYAGRLIFGGSIFDVMSGLVTAIQAGDQDGIDAQVTNLGQFAEVVALTRSKVGGYLNHTTHFENNLAAAKLAHETELSNKETADRAKAISELTMSENGLQAALAVGARISQLSILDYLK